MSPLYDPALATCVHTAVNIQTLYRTDFYYQYLFDRARESWKLLYGNDSLRSLPGPDPERSAAGQLMGIRLWWGCYLASAFGDGPTSRDQLFRHSIAFKTVSEMIRTHAILAGEYKADSRRQTIQQAIDTGNAKRNQYLTKLLATRKSRYRHFAGDIGERLSAFCSRCSRKYT